MEALAVGLLGVVILAAWLVPKWRLRRAISRPLPPEHVAILARNVMQYSGMDDLQRQQLARMVQHFLHDGRISINRNSCIQAVVIIVVVIESHRDPF